MTDRDNPVLEDKAQALQSLLAAYDAVAVAFSGGVDSTLLLAAAQRALGERVVAITAVSEIHPSGEKELAVRMARQLGVRHVLLETDELEDPHFTSNSVERCYYCKRRLFAALKKKAMEMGVSVVAHGANLDDQRDFRPGLRAALEQAIAAPLVEAGFTKSEIRQLARRWRLGNWNRPAMACLATRIPYGRPIRTDDLRQIDRAEAVLRDMGVDPCRVRHYGGMARIEADPGQIHRLAGASLRIEIVKKFQALGYSHVCLDLEGYASGKMNRGITITGRSISADST
jgi:uncharacterized protein